MRRLIVYVFLAAVLAVANGFTKAAPSRPQSARPPVVVCGAGPASLFFAMRLLQLDPSARVEIYEKRARPKVSSQEDASTNTGFRAFGFGIGDRCQAQLEKVPGLMDCVKSISERSRFLFANHRDLCTKMTDYLLATYGPERCQIHFECPVTAIRDDSHAIDVSEPDGTAMQVPYSLLIAADGIHSIIRNQLEAKGEVSTHRYLRNVGWKALQLSPQPNLAPGVGKMYGSYLNQKVFNADGSPVPNFGGLLPRFPSQFVLLMFWRNKHEEGGQRNPFNAETPTEFKQEITKLLPNVTKFPSDEALQQFLSEPPGREIYMKLNIHASPSRRVAFLGDAAAGMYSMLGQGVASACERANLLAETVAQRKGSEIWHLEMALRDFSKQSKQQSFAITDLNLAAHLVEMPGISMLFAKQLQMLRGQIMDRSVTYLEMRRRYRFTILLARFAWWFKRVPFQSSSQASGLEPKTQLEMGRIQAEPKACESSS